MPPRKILFASIVALILIIFSSVVVYKQSKSTSKVSEGILVPIEETAASINSTEQTPTSNTGSTNQTDILSKQVFSNYMVLQQSGNLNDQNVQDLTEQLSDQILASSPSAKVYTLSDIKIISNPTKEDIKNYGNQFFIIRTRSQNMYIRNITAPNSPILDSSINGTANTFVLMGNVYEKIVADLLKLPVPNVLVNLHLQLVNNYAGSAFGLKKFNELNADPIAAVSGLSQYGKNSQEEETLVEKIGQYFIENGIIFSATDPGYGWNTI